MILKSKIENPKSKTKIVMIPPPLHVLARADKVIR